MKYMHGKRVNLYSSFVLCIIVAMYYLNLLLNILKRFQNCSTFNLN